MENQLTIFRRIVYEAVGKYINPTRYCQIIKTESIEKTDTSEEVNLLENQKHTSPFDKIHYQKCKSEDKRKKKTMDKLRDKNESTSAFNLINSEQKLALVIMLHLVLMIVQK